MLVRSKVIVGYSVSPRRVSLTTFVTNCENNPSPVFFVCNCAPTVSQLVCDPDQERHEVPTPVVPTIGVNVSGTTGPQ